MRSNKSSNEQVNVNTNEGGDHHGTLTWAKLGPYLMTGILSLSTGYFISTRDSLNQAVNALRDQYKEEKDQREKLSGTVTDIRFELKDLNNRMQNVERALDANTAGKKK